MSILLRSGKTALEEGEPLATYSRSKQPSFVPPTQRLTSLQPVPLPTKSHILLNLSASPPSLRTSCSCRRRTVAAPSLAFCSAGVFAFVAFVQFDLKVFNSAFTLSVNFATSRLAVASFSCATTASFNDRSSDTISLTSAAVFRLGHNRSFETFNSRTQHQELRIATQLRNSRHAPQPA